MKKILFPLKLKFSILISLLIIILELIIGSNLISYLEKKLTEEVLKRGTQLANNFSAVAFENYTTGDEFPIIVYAVNLLKEEGIEEAFFITKDGYVIAHSDNKKITPEPDADIKDTPMAEQFKPSTEYNKPFFLKGKDLKGDLFGYQFYAQEKYYDIYAPVKYKNKYFGDVHIIFSREIIFKSIREAKRKVFYITVITMLIGLFGALKLSSSVTRPIKILVKGVQIIGTGDLEHRIRIKSRDEIGLLASEFNDMTGKLKEAQKVMMEKQKFDNEMTIASEIQQSLLPDKLPEFEGVDCTAFYRPAKKVGGDYYDFIKISDTKLGIIAADVSGKSVSGSLGMTIFRTIFHSIVSNDLNAFETLCKVNEIIKPDLPDGMFITTFYGILDTENRRLNYAIAGHDPLVVFNSETGELKEFEADGPPVGIMDSMIFDEALKDRELNLQNNDILIQYSDGVLEGMDIDRNQFGEERFHQSIRKHSSLDVKEFVEAIKNDLETFTGDAPQSDDITLIGIKIL